MKLRGRRCAQAAPRDSGENPLTPERGRRLKTARHKTQEKRGGRVLFNRRKQRFLKVRR
jgi:hypothetical protein